MSIDDVSMHLDADYPAGIPRANAGTHIGMYLCWIVENDLVGDMHRDESEEELAAVRARGMTGRRFLEAVCDGKLRDEDLDDDGLAFTAHYYSGQDGALFGPYLDDYARAFGIASLPSMYHVEDTWANYDRLAPLVSAAYARWRASR